MSNVRGVKVVATVGLCAALTLTGTGVAFADQDAAGLPAASEAGQNDSSNDVAGQVRVVLPEGVTAESFTDGNTCVFKNKSGQLVYSETLFDALAEYYKDGPEGEAVLYCKPGADLGSMTHAHVADSITIWGNGATVTEGGEHDIEVDTYKYDRATGKQAADGSYLTSDIEIEVNDLNGIALWGQRNSAYKIIAKFNNCKDMQRVYISGTSGENVIELNSCSYDGKKWGYQDTAIYTNAVGSVTVRDTEFENMALALNLNNKSAGHQAITVENCVFTNCGTEGLAGAEGSDLRKYLAPIRVLNTVEGSTSNLTVKNAAFNYTDGNSPTVNGDILLGEGRTGKNASMPKLAISGTEASVSLQSPGFHGASGVDWSKGQTVPVAKDDTEVSTGHVATVESNGVETSYFTFAEAIKNAKAGDTVKLLSDVTVGSWDQIWNVSGITVNGGGHTLKVNAIESGDNHNALVQSNGGNAFSDLIIDLSDIPNASPFPYRAFSAAPGDSFSKVAIKGNKNLSFGISVDGTDAADEAVSIDGCVFDGMGSAVYDSEEGKVDSLFIKNCTIKNCDYSVIMKSPNGVFSGNTVVGAKDAEGKLNVCGASVKVSGNTFDGVCRLKFYAAPAAFEKNKISADSYLAKSDDLGDAKVDVSKNFWGGEAPSATQIPDGMKTNVEGADVYYVRDAMLDSDLNTYVPPTGGGTVTPGDKTEVEHNADGSTTTTVTKPDGSQTVTHETANGTESVVSKDESGNVVSTEVSVSDKDAESGAVELPIAGVESVADAADALEVEVKVPASVTPDNPVTVTVPVAKAEGDEPNYGLVVFAVDADGNETVLPKSAVNADGSVVFEAEGDVTIKVVDNAKAMPDVKDSDWFAGDVVDFATARGIVNGIPLADGTLEFQGNLGTSRGMFVKMLHNLEMNPEASAGAGFGDVAETDWFADAAAWAVEAGVLEGVETDSGRAFRGEDPVTREQVAMFLMRYADYLGMDTSARAEVAFPDAAEVSGWAYEAMSWAVAEGLFAGNSVTGELNPTDGATRAEIATVLMRFVGGMYA
ncbi:S-layer homology domain-containing protein [uncultured Slackia sp.]|uniref:S-layer homology domain-containing protein n=1 Tax=uncultured Slackia sp. TaxID=665903 RepID=UPI0026DF83D1|nr:S-layer homology domain-containing protein [uncultured Slackia sp.]